MSDPKAKLRWFQFSLRTVFVVVTFFAIPCTWLAIKLRQAERQRETVAAIGQLGGTVVYSEPSGPVLLRALLGRDFYHSVIDVRLNESQVTDAWLKHLNGIDQLQRLDAHNTRITDAGLAAC